MKVREAISDRALAVIENMYNFPQDILDLSCEYTESLIYSDDAEGVLLDSIHLKLKEEHFDLKGIFTRRKIKYLIKIKGNLLNFKMIDISEGN